jgi:arylsulfatase A-like enzyme
VFGETTHPYATTANVFDYPVDLLGNDLMREVYREHIDHLNELVLESLTSLVDTVGEDSIIIVMSDHGSRTYGHEHTLTPDDVAEQFSSLFAARTPDGTELFDDEVMTVNVLSTVFDHYLGTDFPPAPVVTESLDGTQYDEAGNVEGQATERPISTGDTS